MTFKGHGTFTPDGKVKIRDVDAHNAEIERVELEAWASVPDHFYGYDSNTSALIITGPKITTWLGTPIGTVIQRRTYRNALTSSRMTALRIRGTNGAIYHGRHGDSDFVRIHKCK